MKRIHFVIGFCTLLLSCTTRTADSTQQIPSYPQITEGSVTEIYWGKEVTDPYRNLENLEDSVVQNWFQSQSQYAKNILNNIEGKRTLKEKMKDLDDRYSYSIRRTNVSENGQYFYLKKKANEDYYKLYHRKNFSDREEFIFDPRDFKPESRNDYTINYIKPSWDGNYIVVSMSYDGKELSEMVIIDMKQRKVLPEVITNAWPSSFLGINWLPDNSGFTYLYFPIADPSHKDFKKNTKSVLYRIGQNPKKLNLIFSAKTHPQFNILEGDYPTTKIKSSSDKYVIGYLSGVDSYWNAYYVCIDDLMNGTPIWKPLFTKGDRVFRNSGFFHEDAFIYKSSKGASNFKISSFNVASIDNLKILVEEFEEETIENLENTQDGVFFSTLKNGVEAKLYQYQNGNTKEISLPRKSGTIYLGSLGGSYSDLWVYIRGWANEGDRYKYDIEKNAFIKQNMVSGARYPEFDNLVVEEVLVPSHDGVLVPLSIIYDKSLKKNSKNPVIIDSYGAYGDAINPYFSPILLTWVLEGGAFCTAHIRGGGEKGDAWHKGGFKTTKPNSWKDLIACAEYLIKERYSEKKHIATLSGSAGGITVGRAITERPDLFAAAIVRVGQMNPLRNESRPGKGGSNYKEYGSVKDSMECMGLIEMDPYLHIEKNINYPATFLTAGMNDTRITPWVPGKFVARLQASDTKNPIIFNVKYDEGHKVGSNSSKVYEEWANILSFAFWQTGHPDYQLK